MRGHALDEDLEASDALAAGHDLAAVARGLGHQHIFRPLALSLNQGTRGRAADLFVRDIELRDAERRPAAVGAELPEGMMGEIGAALHVVDPRTEGRVALDLERQAVDEAHRMHGVEMAENQNTRRVLSPGRARDQMIAAAVPAGDTFDVCRQVAIEAGDQARELVDLLGRVGGGLDFDPASDAVENGD
jgi:hypothetical protein